jgi:hypothetical protein
MMATIYRLMARVCIWLESRMHAWGWRLDSAAYAASRPRPGPQPASGPRHSRDSADKAITVAIARAAYARHVPAVPRCPEAALVNARGGLA